MSIEEKKDQKCNRCRSYRYPRQFINSTGRVLKTCDPCRERCKISREKNRCEHGRQKKQCKECGGSQICEHNREKTTCKECSGGAICEHDRIRSQCKECRGSQICEHDRIRSQCKDCMNNEQKIEYIQKRMISHSREKDKKINKYDVNNFIDKPFLEGLFEDSSVCHYCSIDFTYNERIDTLVTIERLNNTIGHTKSNCVLACWKCNLSHKGNNDIRT